VQVYCQFQFFFNSDFHFFDFFFFLKFSIKSVVDVTAYVKVGTTEKIFQSSVHDNFLTDFSFFFLTEKYELLKINRSNLQLFTLFNCSGLPLKIG